MIEHCEFCIWWQFAYDDGDGRLGICNSTDVNDDVRIAEENNFNDEVIFTKETFGCVWFRKEPLVVAEIKLPKK